jgi:hypothetical protein
VGPGGGQGGGHGEVRGTMGPRVPGARVPPLKGVSTVSIKQTSSGTFRSTGYYNDTEKMVVKTIIERFENIRKVQDIKGAGLGGLKMQAVRNKNEIETNTYSSPGKRRRITLCNTEEEGKRGGGGRMPQSPRGSVRKRGTRGTATPPSRGMRKGTVTSTMLPRMMGVPPTTLCQARTSPPCATRPPSGPPPPPSSPPGSPAPAPISQSGILTLRKLWERGPPQSAVKGKEWSSSPVPTEKKIRKLVKSQDSRRKSPKETENMSGRKKKEKEEEVSISSSSTTPNMSRRKACTMYKPNERLAYLVGGREMKTDMAGFSGATQLSLASSSSTRCPAGTSSSSGTAMQQLPPAELRSLSPTLLNSNGSTFSAHCQQLHIADKLTVGRRQKRYATNGRGPSQGIIPAGTDNRDGTNQLTRN